MDSFNIAVYLDNKYPGPEYPTVIPPGMRNIQKLAVEHIMGVGISFAPVILPYAAIRPGFLDEKGHEYYTRTRKAMFGKDLSEVMKSSEENWKKAKTNWEALGNSINWGRGGTFYHGEANNVCRFCSRRYAPGHTEIRRWRDDALEGHVELAGWSMGDILGRNSKGRSEFV
jgi:hypothetical protein